MDVNEDEAPGGTDFMYGGRALYVCPRTRNAYVATEKDALGDWRWEYVSDYRDNPAGVQRQRLAVDLLTVALALEEGHDAECLQPYPHVVRRFVALYQRSTGSIREGRTYRIVHSGPHSYIAEWREGHGEAPVVTWRSPDQGLGGFFTDLRSIYLGQPTYENG